MDQFITDFDFQLTDATADGFAFVLQDLGPDALGSSGGGVGYGNPPAGVGPAIGTPYIILPDNGGNASHTDSTAIVFDLHNNQGEGNNSIRIQVNGVTNKGGAVDLTPYGIDLHSGHPLHARILESGPSTTYGIEVVVTDLQTNAVADVHLEYIFAQVADVPVGYGYAGFTAGTGNGTAVQTIKNWTFSSTAVEAGLPSQPNFPNGFPNTNYLKLNGGVSLSGSALQLTQGTPFEASSVFTIPQIYTDQFVTDFDFKAANGEGDGFAFVIQHEHISSVGASGGGLGYGPDKPGAAEPAIGNRAAVKFDLHNNAGEGDNSTGVYVDGASPTFPAVDLYPSGINLHNGHTFHAHISCGFIGGAFPTLTVTIVDLDQYKVFEQSFTQPGFFYQPGANFIGFTAGTGATPSSISVLNWTYHYGYVY